ncbi:amino acid permease [Legionella sp. W05-934-2]|jgi:amino acid transporter|uniref:amino acid permease n=1 Tax=Legionella sp. W05-934-2 TaxID=1198649 RepID=UPI0034624A22
MRPLSTWSLALITIGSVDSIRNLPAAALAGRALPGYFLLAFLLFLLPCAIVCGWFSYQSPHGILGWVRKGLGQRMGIASLWLQFMQNILIYPTFFALIAGSLLFCINPASANHIFEIFILINGLIWLLTIINFKGIQLSSRVNTLCTTIGLLLPFAILLLIGVYTLWNDPHSLSTLPKPQEDGYTSLTAIMLSFCGLELAAVHSHGTSKHAFRNAVVVAVIVIFITLLMGAVTLAMIIPLKKLNFVSDIPH